MTSHHDNRKTRGKDNSLLRLILDHVESIDQNVERILENFDEHLDESRYRQNWSDRSYNGDREYA